MPGNVTAIVSTAQLEYRLADDHGCGPDSDEREHSHDLARERAGQIGPDEPGREDGGHAGAGSAHDGTDRALDYRVLGMGGDQVWFGSGLAEFGLEHAGVREGAPFTRESVLVARAMMSGVDPRTGAVLVAPVVRVPDDGKLAAVPLLDHLVERGLVDAAQGSPKAAAEWKTFQGGAARLGDGYTVDVRQLAKIAGRAGVSLEDVYDADAVRSARAVADTQRLDVRVRGYDLTLTLPKSFSDAWALAPAGQRQQISDTYVQAVREVLETAEDWHAKAARGEHGGGKVAQLVDTTGLAGFVSVHPVNRNGDTHWHAHAVISGMVRGVDGQWSQLSNAGGEGLFQSGAVLNEMFGARARALTAERFGWEFRESELTGRLEVAHVSDGMVRATSTRHADVVAAKLALGVQDPRAATKEQDEQAAQTTRKTKVKGAEQEPALVARTRAQVTAEGIDVPAAGLVPTGGGTLAALRPAEYARRVGYWKGQQVADRPGRPDTQRVWVPGDGLAPGSWEATVADARALLLSRQDGPTAHAQEFTDNKAMALLFAKLPAVTSLERAELVAAAALDTRDMVRLPWAAGMPRMAARFTTREVVDAEVTVLAAARRSAAGVDDAGRPLRVPTVTDAQLSGAVRALQERKTRQSGRAFTLNPEQIDTVSRLTQGGRKLDTVLGLPGTGKSTIMRAVVDAYTAAGIKVCGAATAAIAAQGLAAQTGMTTVTVAVAANPLFGGVPEGTQVLIVDEAGLTDTRDLASLVRASEDPETGFQLILIGDDKQLPAVGIGGAFAAAHALVDGPELRDVRRQKGDHEKAALLAFRAGDVATALGIYYAAGQVTVTDTREEAMRAAAAAYARDAAGYDGPVQRVTQVALLTGRREDATVLNAMVRQHARDAGALGRREGSYRLPGGGQLTLAVGDAVILKKNQTIGEVTVRNGQRAEVVGIGRRDEALTLAWTDVGGERHRLRLTKGDVAAGEISDAYVESDHVQLGAAVTVHSAQGRTVDVAHIVAEAGGHASLYVSLSRDEQTAHTYLSVESLTTVPEERARLAELAVSNPAERDRQVLAMFVDQNLEARDAETRDNTLLVSRYTRLAPELRDVLAGLERDQAAVEGRDPAGIDDGNPASRTPAAVAAAGEVTDLEAGQTTSSRPTADVPDHQTYDGGKPMTTPDFRDEPDSRSSDAAGDSDDRKLQNLLEQMRAESAAAEAERDLFRASPEGVAAEMADLTRQVQQDQKLEDLIEQMRAESAAAEVKRATQPAAAAVEVDVAADTEQPAWQDQRAAHGVVAEGASVDMGDASMQTPDIRLIAARDPISPTAPPDPAPQDPTPQERTDGVALAPAEDVPTGAAAGSRPPAKPSLLERTRSLTASIKQGAAATEQVVQDAQRAAAQNESERDRGRAHQQPAPIEQQGPSGLDR